MTGQNSAAVSDTHNESSTPASKTPGLKSPAPEPVANKGQVYRKPLGIGRAIRKNPFMRKSIVRRMPQNNRLAIDTIRSNAKRGTRIRKPSLALLILNIYSRSNAANHKRI